MKLDICLDGESFRLNNDEEMELFFDPEFFEFSMDGSLAFKNTFGYMREFTPRLYSNSTEVTNPEGQAVGLFSRMRTKGNRLTHGDAKELDYYLTRFAFVYKLGEGFSVPTGTLNWGSTFISNGQSGSVFGAITGRREGAYDFPTGLAGQVAYISGAVKPYMLWPHEWIGMKDFVGGNITNSTNVLGVGHTFVGSGFCYNPVFRDSSLI